jgi:hypothetical protein
MTGEFLQKNIILFIIDRLVERIDEKVEYSLDDHHGCQAQQRTSPMPTHHSSFHEHTWWKKMNEDNE